MSTAKERVCDFCRGPLPASSYMVDGATVCHHCYNREWLKRMADAEDECGSTSVGGLAADMGQLMPSDDDEPIMDAWMESEFGNDVLWLPCDSDLSPVLISDDGKVRINITGEDIWPLPHIRTRRQLRDLLAALGYRREG